MTHLGCVHLRCLVVAGAGSSEMGHLWVLASKLRVLHCLVVSAPALQSSRFTSECLLAGLMVEAFVIIIIIVVALGSSEQLDVCICTPLLRLAPAHRSSRFTSECQ